jgi:hypothetical protein
MVTHSLLTCIDLSVQYNNFRNTKSWREISLYFFSGVPRNFFRFFFFVFQLRTVGRQKEDLGAVVP